MHVWVCTEGLPLMPGCVGPCDNDGDMTCAILETMLGEAGCATNCTHGEKGELKGYLALADPPLAKCSVLANYTAPGDIDTTLSAGNHAAPLAFSAALCALASLGALLLA